MLLTEVSGISTLRMRYLRDEIEPVAEAENALAHANSNTARNVYLAQDAAWTLMEAARLERQNLAEQPLWGVPVSLKDCFDLAGFPTSCGSTFYRDSRGSVAEDSAVALRLRAAGAVITGKTHLHQLAYGITGENSDFGDCTQPCDASRLTGGSSSGAAASVLEGSALAAIGTDTGGSIRVPAAMCGLAGYRSSITLQGGMWKGGAHLAPTFDTLGWLYRDLSDGPVLGAALFDLAQAQTPALKGLRIGVPSAAFLHDCDADVLGTQQAWTKTFLERGARVAAFETEFWSDCVGLFFHIQATEAAVMHWGHYSSFEPAIAERLTWGASVSERELDALLHLLKGFRQQMDTLQEQFDYLLLPCAPTSALRVGDDHSKARQKILRYTAPMSLAGLPVVALPGRAGGVQLVGRLGADAELLALSASLADAAPFASSV